MNTDTAFKVCPRCSGLASERTDKCLSCGYRRRFVVPAASDVLKVIGMALLGASMFFVAVMALAAEEVPANWKLTNAMPLTLNPWTNTSTELISIHQNGTNVIAVDVKGAVRLAPGVSADDASKQFWNALTTNFPSIRQQVSESHFGVPKNELLATLRQVQVHLQPSEGPFLEHAVYKSPAQRLREQADAIERKDAAIAAFNALIQKLESAK